MGERRELGFLLIPLLLAALLLPARSSAERPAENRGRAGRAPQEALAPSDLLSQFICADANGSSEISEEAGEPVDGSWKITNVVVLVPDPIDSSLAYVFDRYVEAIRLAAEAAQYDLDRFDLPWLDDVSKAGAAPAGPATGSRPDQAAPRYRSEPGEMLFRTAKDDASLLRFLLVGETPTGGVNKTVLRNALDRVGGVARRFETTRCGKAVSVSGADSIRIVGPSFSGSERSLATALEVWLSQHPDTPERVSIVSGSATVIAAGSESALGRLDRVSYATTVYHDEDASRALMNYLRDRLPEAYWDRVAILAESGTAYGRKAAVGTGSDASRENPGIRPRGFRFPLHIAELRRASAGASGDERVRDPLSAIESTNRVPLPLAEAVQPSDTPRQTSALSASTTEDMVEDMLDAIQRDGIDTVILSATDVRDAVFLTGELRRRCPDVSLYLLSADYVFLHSRANRDFCGVRVVTPYPLFGPNQTWSRPFAGSEARQAFPDQNTQGVYNAVLHALGRPELMLEYGPPFRNPEKAVPPLWLTAVGRDGFWPIAMLAPSPTKASMPVAIAKLEAGSEHRTQGAVARGTILQMCLVAMVCCVPAALVIAQWVRRRLVETMPVPWMSVPAPVTSAAVAGRPGIARRPDWAPRPLPDAMRGQFLLLLCLGVGSFLPLMLAVVSAPIRAGVSAAGFAPSREEVAVFLVAAVAMLVVVSAACLLAVPMFRARFGRRLRTYFPVAIGFVIFAASVVVAVDWVGRPVPEALSLYLRAIRFGSGLSPLLPLLLVLAAGSLYGASSVKRLWSLEASGLGRSTLGAVRGSLVPLIGAAGHIRRALETPALALPFSAVAAILVLVPTLVLFVATSRPFVHAFSLERPLYDVLFALTFSSLYLSLVLTALRLITAWRRTRRLLTLVAAHPLSRAFSRLRARWAPEGGVMVSNPISSLVAKRRSTEIALELLSSPGGGSPAADLFRARVEGARGAIDAARDRVARGKWRQAIVSERAATANLASAVSVVAPELERLWTCPELCRAGGSGDDKQPGRKELAEELIASRVVEFLSGVFAHVRALATCVTGGVLLMLLAVGCYPFHFRDSLLLFNWTIIVALVLTTVVVLVQMNRDPILSILANTTPNRVSWDRDFVIRMAVFGALPILGLLGVQFPASWGQIGPRILNLLAGGG